MAMRRLDTMFDGLGLIEGTYNFPSINSNQTVTDDITVTGVQLGDMIISWTPSSDATEIEDLQIQFLIINTNTIRATLSNPTGGAIDPGAIDLIFFVGRPKTAIVQPA